MVNFIYFVTYVPSIMLHLLLSQGKGFSSSPVRQTIVLEG